MSPLPYFNLPQPKHYLWLAAILWIGTPNVSHAEESFYFVQREFFGSATSQISVEKENSTIKWQDDYPTAYFSNTKEFGVVFFENYLLSLHQLEINGTHTGEASQYQCILGFCSYVGTSLVNSSGSTSSIKYNIKSNQLMLAYKLYDNSYLTLKPKIGINILEIGLEANGSGEQVTQSDTVPIPQLGGKLQLKVAEGTLIEFDFNYFKYTSNGKSAEVLDRSVFLRTELFEHVSLEIGQRSDVFNMTSTTTNSKSIFDYDKKNNFIGIRFSY